jgi:hypothetical protein
VLILYGRTDRLIQRFLLPMLQISYLYTLDGISPCPTGQLRRRKMHIQICIHSPIGIKTHDLCLWASENYMCLTTRGYLLLPHNKEQELLGRTQVKVMLRPTVSRPLSLGARQTSGTLDQFFSSSFIILRQLRVHGCGTPSLMRGWVCSLQLLLGLPSAAFLGSESSGTHERILLSQNWNSPNLQVRKNSG